jgi:predicted transcriptional regulator
LLAAIDQQVTEQLAAAGITAPPVDTVALAERHVGLTIRRQPGARPGRSRKAGEPRTLVLDPDASDESRQWSAAQAIGAEWKPNVLRRLSLEADASRGLGGPSMANRIAERLLLPTAWYAADAASLDYDLLALKERYRTAGFELIALRWLDLPEPCVVTILDGTRVHRRRGNARRVNKRLSAAEVQCARAVAVSGRPRTVSRGGWTTHGWPVPSSGGDRVILRSVVDEDAAQGLSPD